MPVEKGTKTVQQVLEYYEKSPNYLYGPLAGACHFGYTPEGVQFELKSALTSMEMLLGEKLDLPTGSTVVDAGCGFGRVATTLASDPYGLNVVGVDLIPERLQEASSFTTAHGVSGKVKLVNGNYCALPLTDSSVSGVYTIETLVHADPLEAALSEFWRVLEPGGRVVLFEYSVPDRNRLDPFRKAITDEMVRRTGMASIGRFVHGAFPSILQSAGFENVEVENISRHVWPTWRWMFFDAIHEFPKSLRSERMNSTNLAASFMIWPYKSQLGYNVVTANKPN